MEASDEAHLKLLAIAHYVLAGLTAAMAAFFVPPAVNGWRLLEAAKQGLPASAAPQFESGDQAYLGALLFSFGVSVAALCLVHGGVLAYIGRCLARRRRRTLCLAFSALHLINVPLGTVLSVLTFLVLRRPEVREAFSAARSA